MRAVIAKARDLREGGAWSPLQRAKNDVIHALACIALFFVRRANAASLARLGRTLGAFVHAFGFGLRGRALENLAVAFPDSSRSERARLARASFANLGADLGEAFASLRTPARSLPFDRTSRDVLRAALDEGRGVILPSAHLGPWERLAATLVAAEFPLTAIVRESYDPRFDRIVDGARARSGVLTIARGAPGAGARIVRALRSCRVLGIPMDLRTRAESVTVPLLGGAAPTAVGPARIALRTGAPVVVCTVEPDEDGALGVTCTRIVTSDLSSTDEVALTARINAELDRRIRRTPDRWMWMHGRFAT